MPDTVDQTQLFSKGKDQEWNFSFLMSAAFTGFLDLIPEAAILSTTSGEIILTNEAAQKLFQYSDMEFTQHVIEDLVPEKIRNIHPKLRADFFENPKPRFLAGRHLELVACKKDGSLFPMESALFAIRTEQGAIAVNLIRDISNQQAETKQIAEYAFVDALTNLPNRRYFDDSIRRHASKARRNQETLALLYIDLDEFKQINDNYGHEVGDRVLHEVTSRLSKLIRTEDVLARVGGDEFVLMVYPVSDEHYLNVVAERILSACSKPVIINEDSFQLFASIGISMNTSPRFQEKELIHSADKAMYKAKKQGGNCFVHAKRKAP